VTSMAIKCKGLLFGRKQAGTLFIGIGIGKPTFATQGPPLPGRSSPDLVQPVGSCQVEGDQRHSWLVLDDVPPEGTPARAVVRLRRRNAESVAAALAEEGYQVTQVPMDKSGFRQFADATPAPAPAVRKTVADRLGETVTDRLSQTTVSFLDKLSQAADRTASDILDAVKGSLEPGEKLIAGCDGKVPAEVPFLDNSSTVNDLSLHPHYVALTTQRVMVFALSLKRFNRGLRRPPRLMRAVPRSEVRLAHYQPERFPVIMDLVFADGQAMPFEAQHPLMAAKIAAQLPGLLADSPMAAGRGGIPVRQLWKHAHKIAAVFALLLSAVFLFEGLHHAVSVDRAQIVRAYNQGSKHTELDFADISGPGAADVETQVQDAGPAFTLARQSKLPLTVQIRSENGLITAVYIGGAWQNVWTISDTSSLVLGIVFGLIGALLLAWPWLRWITRPSTRGSMAW
jgi:hypothetical protein